MKGELKVFVHSVNFAASSGLYPRNLMKGELKVALAITKRLSIKLKNLMKGELKVKSERPCHVLLVGPPARIS